jgi:hypothetical protein
MSIIIGTASGALSDDDSQAAQNRTARDRLLSYLRSRSVPHFFQKISSRHLSLIRMVLWGARL